jgi:hypothetical protein
MIRTDSVRRDMPGYKLQEIGRVLNKHRELLILAEIVFPVLCRLVGIPTLWDTDYILIVGCRKPEYN